MTRSIAVTAAVTAPHSRAAIPAAARSAGIGLRVVMVVANDVTRDSRVLREAAVLAAAGHRVTVLGIMTAHTTAPAIEMRDGFVIRRLPFRARPPGWWVPPDVYARVRARASRQYRIHGARFRAVLRGARAGSRRLGAQARSLPRRAPVAGRRFLSRLAQLPEWISSREWRRRVATEPAPSHVSVPRRSSRSRFLREPRGLARRARRTPLSEWPGKTMRLALRGASRMADAAGHSGHMARRSVRRAYARLEGPIASARLLRRGAVYATRQAGGSARDGGVRAQVIAQTVWRGIAAWAGILRLLVWGTAYLGANGATGGALEWLTGWRWRWLGWARYVAQNAPDADVWHGHDLTSLPAVVALKQQRGGIAVYDSHEIYLESGRHAEQPRWAKRQLERLERSLAAEVDAVITVNRSLADILAERLGRPEIGVLYNCPSRFEHRRRPSRLRAAVALPPHVPLLLYHGSLSPHRGVEQLLSMIQLPAMAGVHLAFLGFGQMLEWLRTEVRDPLYEGRVHLVQAVRPDELLDWLVGVDVAVAPIQDSTLNHHYSSPNKVFEAIAVGTPVAGSDLPEFRSVIAESGYGSLGALFDPTSPEAIAAAVRSLLDLPSSERIALRRRCRAAAAGRWNWETEGALLVDLYRGFSPDAVAYPVAHAVGVA